MRKELFNEKIPFFKAPKHYNPNILWKNRWPYNLNVTFFSKKPHIREEIGKDIKREIERREKFYKDFFRKLGLEKVRNSQKLIELFEKKIDEQKEEKWMTTNDFIEYLYSQYPKKEKAEYNEDTYLTQEIPLANFEKVNESATGRPVVESTLVDQTPDNKDTEIDIGEIRNLFLKQSIDPDEKVPLSHLVKLSVLLGILPIEKLQKLSQLRDEPSFWESVYLAWHIMGLDEIKIKPKLFILRPRANEPDEELEALLDQEGLRLETKISTYNSKIRKRYGWITITTKHYGVGNILEILSKYPGTYKENQVAWKLYMKIMGDQGKLQEMLPEYYHSPFPLTEGVEIKPPISSKNPGFIHYLVEAAERVSKKQKYSLAHEFLKVYLGITVESETIKQHLRPDRIKTN